MTPQRRSDDIVKYKVSIRDVFILLIGAAGMWGTQVATQGNTRAAIDNLATKIEGYQQKQSNTNDTLQRQLDDVRKAAALAIVNDAQTAKELAELKGYLAGSGVKVKP